jgi:response regulator RpfG family c-di-GMP phosphodiesterase
VKSVSTIARELRWGRRVLLVGGSEFRRSLRASILRAHGLQVDVARRLADSGVLSQQHAYDWVLLDTRSLLPGEVIDACEQLKRAAPEQRIAFFVGPPAYVALTWPVESVAEDTGKEQHATPLNTAA